MRARTRIKRMRERGVAVITALLLTTLAVSIVASLFWQQQVQVRSMENQRLHLQTQWILRGALDWATLVLDTFRGAQYTSLDQAWATPLADTRLDQYIERERVEGEQFDASLSGTVMDACSRYNLRNLADQGRTNVDQLNAFKRLLQNLQLNQNLATYAADFVRAGQPLTAQADSSGANPAGTAQQTSSSTSGVPMKLLQVDDLLAVQGFTPEIVERLRPFVIVLPDATPVNVNTAPAEVLAAAANISLSEANSLVVRRQTAPWRDQNYFASDAKVDVTALPPGSIATTSDYFLVDSRIRLDRAALDAEALVHRGSILAAGGTSVVWIHQY